jgi:hypothetical protein
MKSVFHSRFVGALIAAATLGLLFSCARSANAQLLYSFETPTVDGWGIGAGPTPPAAPTTTTLGVTEGTKALSIPNLAGAFNNDVGHVTQGSATGDLYTVWNDAANAIASGKDNVKLEFDFSWDHANVTAPGWGAQLGIFVNSTPSAPFTNGFLEYGTGQLIGGLMGGNFPALAPAAIADGVTLTSLSPSSARIAIPMSAARATSDNQGLHIMPGSFYQMGFKTNGGWTGTANWAVDNIRITGAQVPTSTETLFSWETPDSPSTPAVNESFEGWIQGGVGTNPPHVHSIVTTGATQGTHALQIDRTTTPAGFTWGSSYNLSSIVNPGPSQTIDPVVQSTIDTLVTKINAADRVAFDVTYQYHDYFEQGINNPTFTNFFVHFADESGNQFQAGSANIPISSSDPNQHTVKVEIPLSSFIDFNNSALNLDNTGLLVGTHQLRIALGTSTDGAQIYQVDNFRLVTVLPEGVPGDYNNNGAVDAADYVLWREGGPLQNEVESVGTVTAADYDAWRARFGNTTAGSGASNPAVPEPAALALLFSAIFGSLFARRRFR